MKTTIYSDLFSIFKEIAEGIPEEDAVMLREAWNDYTDGELSGLLYHYCPPATDGAMPEDAFGHVAGSMQFHVDGAELCRAGHRVRLYAEHGSEPWEALAAAVERGDTALADILSSSELAQLVELVEVAE